MIHFRGILEVQLYNIALQPPRKSVKKQELFPIFKTSPMPRPDDMSNLFIVEALHFDGSVERILAYCDNAIFAGAAFRAACEHLPNQTFMYRIKARVIDVREI